MAVSNLNISFLDLSDLDDHEKSFIYSKLYTETPCVQLPWAKDRTIRDPEPGNSTKIPNVFINGNYPNSKYQEDTQQYAPSVNINYLNDTQLPSDSNLIRNNASSVCYNQAAKQTYATRYVSQEQLRNDVARYVSPQEQVRNDVARYVSPQEQVRNDVARYVSPQEQVRNDVARYVSPHEQVSNNTALYVSPQEQVRNDAAQYVSPQEQTRNNVARYVSPQEQVRNDAAQYVFPQEQIRNDVARYVSPQEQVRSDVAQYVYPQEQVTTHANNGSFNVQPSGTNEVAVNARKTESINSNHTSVTQRNGYPDQGVSDKEKSQSSPTENKWAKNKSWSSVFNKSSSNVVSNENIIDENQNSNSSAVNNKKNVNIEEYSPINRLQLSDPNCYRMGEFLLNHNVDGKAVSLQPRGLINKSNYCYINSILQALLACPPVYNLLVGLSAHNTSCEKQKSTPIIDGMCRLVKEFHHLPAVLRVNKRNDKNQKKSQKVSIDCDLPFEPSWIYKMLSGVRSDSFLIEGRQEDAEEFLGCLLNGMNDEMHDLMGLVKNTVSTVEIEDFVNEQDVDKEWQVMGPKNKGGVTRQTNIVKTPISDIFGGSLKSRIYRAGDQSTYNIQPFFTLQLNIEKVKTVREALEALVSKIQLEGVTSSKTNQEVEAWQQVMLEELPIILILHLKCFDFQLDGCTKIIKALEFPVDLKIDSKLLSSKPSSLKEKQYKLFAVVYHDGKEATKGHYVTDAFHVGYSSWIRYDDSALKIIQEEQVLKPQGTRVPYLLFYRRSDTIRSK